MPAYVRACVRARARVCMRVCVCMSGFSFLSCLTRSRVSDIQFSNSSFSISRVSPFDYCNLPICFVLTEPRHFCHMRSSRATQANGLPSHPMLGLFPVCHLQSTRPMSPTLFNLHTNDLPVTASRKFVYVNDIFLLKQGQPGELECSLTADMERMAAYCNLWRLKLSPSKMVSSVFHMLNSIGAL